MIEKLKTSALYKKITALSEKGGFIKKLFPWFMAAAILLYLFMRIDMGQFMDALSRADMSLYFPLTIIFIIVLFIVESQNIYALARIFGHRVPFKGIVDIRGSSYLLTIINYTLGMGSITYYLKKYQNIPIMQGTSLMVFFNSLSHSALVLLAAIGCLVNTEASALQGKILIFCSVLMALYIAWILILKLLPEKGLSRRLKNLAIMKIYIDASAADYLVMTLYRLFYYGIFIVYFYGAVRVFHMEIPLMVLVTSVPIILLIISLPVTSFGLGTSQAAMLLLFSNYGSEGQILAFSLVYSAGILLFRAFIGIIYFKKMNRIVPYNTTFEGELT